MKVEIILDRVNNIGASTKGIDDQGNLDIDLKLNTNMQPGQLARILNLLKQRIPFKVIITSDQAIMDLEFMTLKEVEKLEKGSVVEAGLEPDSTLKKTTKPIEVSELSLKPGDGDQPVESMPAVEEGEKKGKRSRKASAASGAQ